MVKTQQKLKNPKSPSPRQQVLDGTTSDAKAKVLVCLALVAITVIAYLRVFGCDFIKCYDDQAYVSSNPFITKGFGIQSLTWAFTTFRCGNWHPLTWLSHMADYQLYGLSPMGHHVTNLVFHVANTLLLFLVLTRMTGATWRSGFVAALFAIHPLHVESVAWVAERKDVLSAFFWLVTMHAYVLYAKRPSIVRYVPVIIAFGLGLLAKPMLVSLPLTLLLLDYWPLDRANLRWRLVWEKAPLFLMSAAACVITVVAQKAGNTLSALGWLPFGYRLGNAAVAYVGYTLKMIWPSHLAVLYPHPGINLPIWQAIAAGIALVAISLAVLRWGRRRPYLTVGWLWYVITLVPVIGLVQVGLQAMADRYSYMSLVGLFIIVAWGVPEMLARRSTLQRLLPVSAAAVIVLLSVCTWVQVGYWHDPLTLFDHTINVTKDNFIAYNLRGLVLQNQGRMDEAISDLTEAVDIQPAFAQGHYYLGAALIANGQAAEAVPHLLTDLELGMDTADVRHNLAQGYYSLGKLDLAAEQCRQTLSLNPKSAEAHNMLGAILYGQQKIDGAISEWRAAAEQSSSYPDPHGNLAAAYFTKGNYVDAWREVHIFASMGRQPDPRLIEALSKRMPDPGS